MKLYNNLYNYINNDVFKIPRDTYYFPLFQIRRSSSTLSHMPVISELRSPGHRIALSFFFMGLKE